MNFRRYLIIVIIISLLIWGPIDHTWPAWLAIRLGYLVLIPLTVWFLLRWLWNIWEPNTHVEEALERILSGLVASFLFLMAIFEFKSNTHIGNTAWIRTRDGMEAVGDDIVLNGPDYGNVVVLTGIALFFVWHSVSKRK